MSLHWLWTVLLGGTAGAIVGLSLLAVATLICDRIRKP